MLRFLFIEIDLPWLEEDTALWVLKNLWGRRPDLRRWCQLALTSEQRSCALEAVTAKDLLGQAEGLYNCMH